MERFLVSTKNATHQGLAVRKELPVETPSSACKAAM